jgi:endonuclease/exonuclease/phosphatase family metal-dependent hydrolase
MENCKIRVGTFNIRNVTDHYEKRLPLLKEAIYEMNFDICAFQEVSYMIHNQLSDFYEANEYNQFLASTQLNYAKVNQISDEKFNIDGNAFLVRPSFLEDKFPTEIQNMEYKIEKYHKILHLSPLRCAHMLKVTHPSFGKINIINCHLHHVETEEIIRLYQMNSLLKWIAIETEEEDLTLLLGDFNTLPNSETYNFIISEGYLSSYKQVHKNEPDHTFHNRMDAPHKDNSDNGTFDYIL